MSLQWFIQALRRRWKLFLAIVVGMLVLLFATFRPYLRLYRAEMRFIVGTRPLDSTLESEEEGYWNWLASEYVVVAVNQYINGNSFKSEVSRRMIADGYSEMDPEAIDEFLSAGSVNSRLIVAVVHPEEAMVERLAFTAASTLLALESVELSQVNEPAPVDLQLPQLERSPAFVYPLDGELLVQELDLSSDLLGQIVPRVLTAVVVGLLVVLVLEFFDPTIRTRVSAETLSFPILAEIPNDQ